MADFKLKIRSANLATLRFYDWQEVIKNFTNNYQGDNRFKIINKFE